MQARGIVAYLGNEEHGYTEFTQDELDAMYKETFAENLEAGNIDGSDEEDFDKEQAFEEWTTEDSDMNYVENEICKQE